MASPPNPAQPLKSDTSAEPSQDDVPDIATEKVRMPLGKGADAPSTAPSSSSVPSPRSHDAKNESNLPVVLSGVLALGIVCAIVGCLVTSIIPSGTSCLQWLPVLFLVSLLWFRAFLAWKPRRFWKVFCHGFLYSARNVLVWGAIVALPVVLSVGTDQTSTTNAATTATMVNQVPWSVGTDQTTTQVVKTSFSYWLTVLNIALVVEIVVSLLQFCRRGCDVPNKFAPAKVRLLFTKKRFFRDFWDNILSFALTAFVWGALAVLPVAWSIGVAEIQKNPLSYCVPVLSIAVVFGIGVSVLRMFLWWSEAPTELPKDDGFSILPKAQSVATYFSNQAKKVRERSNSLTGRGATRLYGVYGQRGVGKSTFLRQIEAKLETDECIIAIYYDAWKWQTTGNAPEWTLLTQIFANPRVRNVAWFKKPLLLNLVSLVTTLRVTFGNTNAQIQIDSTTSAIRRIELALLAAGYRRLFKFLEKCGISVLLLIDEVDRCDRLYFQGVLALWQRYLKENNTFVLVSYVHRFLETQIVDPFMKWKEFQDDEKKDDEKSIQARREKDYLWRRNEVKKEYDRFLPDLRDALIADYEEAGGDRDKFVADVHARFSEVTWFLSPPSFDSKEQKESIEKIIKEFLMDFSAKDAGGISSEIHKFMGGSAVNLDSIYELFSDKRGYRGIPRHFVHAIKSVIPLFVDACDVHGIARNNETLPMQPTLGNMLRIAFGCFAQIKNKETTYIQWSDTSEIFSGWLGSSERDGEISFVVFNDSFRNKGDVSPEWAKVFDTMISFYLRSKKYTEETVQHGTTTSQSVPPVGGKSVKERFELALEMANSGMFDKAEIEYTTCMQDTSMNPDDIQLKVKACLNLGKIYVRQGRFDDARTCYTKGMAMGKKEQFPVEKAQILNALGKSYIEEMKPENRSTMCDAAIRSYNECVKFVVDTKSTDTEVLSEKARAENYIDEANACKDACKDLPKEIADVFSPTGIEGFEFRPIPSGEFTMGSPKGEKGRDTDEQQHKVIITKPFWLGRTPVTQGQWKAVMGTSLQEQFDMAWNSSAKCWPGKDNKVSSLITMKEWFKNRGLENYEDVKRRFLGNVGENYPMNWVSYDNAVAFCKKLTEQERADGRLPEGYAYALPTEAQWEYACRAGGSGAYGRMEDGKEGDLDKMGWYREDSNSTTHPVAQKKPNAWGLYDMHGNVWEWCADWYDNYRTGSVTDPSGPRSGVARVRRGGGWDYPAAYCRSAYRDRNVPAYRSGNLGFRLALRPVLGDD